jgi:hypothetical protein
MATARCGRRAARGACRSAAVLAAVVALACAAGARAFNFSGTYTAGAVVTANTNPSAALANIVDQ